MRGKSIAVFLCVFAAITQASILKWDSAAINYPAGSLNTTFNNVGGSGVNMNFQWVGNTGNFLTNYQVQPGVFVTLPDDDPVTSLMPGVNSGLWYGTSGTSAVSLIMTFSQPVTNVHFKIYDIDSIDGAGKEKLRIKGFLNGVAVATSQYDADAGSDVNITYGDVATGVIFENGGMYDNWPPYAANEGWITISGPITSIGMEFTNKDGSRGEILSDITFVPEPASLLILGIGSMFFAVRRK